MRYRVIGADEVSGEAMELIVEAKDEADARFKAGARGLRAERVEMEAASAPERAPAKARESPSGLGERDAGAVEEGPERDVWSGGPSQWVNAGKYALALVGLAALVLGAIFVPKWLGADRTVWLAVLGAVLLPALYAFWVWLRTRTHRYRVTTQRLVIRTGILTRHVEEVELFRILDAEPRQTLAQRLLRTGTLTLKTTDSSMPTVVLSWVPDHLEMWNTMRPLIAERRRNHRILEGVGEL